MLRLLINLITLPAGTSRITIKEKEGTEFQVSEKKSETPKNTEFTRLQPYELSYVTNIPR